MKNITNILLASTLVILGLSGCTMKVNKTQTSDPSAYKAPVLDAINDVVIDGNNSGVEAVVFSWTSADFGAPTQIEYNLYMTYGDKTALVGQSYYNSLSVKKSDLNNVAVSELGMEKNTSGTVGAFLEACVYGTTLSTVTSNTINFGINTFDAPKNCIYLPGYYDGWNKAGTPFWEMEAGSDKYRILVKFKEDETNTAGYCPFKLNLDGTDGGWNGYNDGYTAEWGDADFFANSDGNFAVPVGEEINFLTVNLKTKELSRTVVSGISLIGSFAASNGWSTDVYFDYDATNVVWVSEALEFAAGDEFLIRTNDSWDSADKYGDATVKSSEVSGGFELTNSGSAANIKIDDLGGAGTYVMKLYGNHTPLVLVAEKQ